MELGLLLISFEKLFCGLTMAPKKRMKVETGSSSQGCDGRIFATATAHACYQWLSTKVDIGDRGLECNEEPYRHDP